jgi:hypothetical protein
MIVSYCVPKRMLPSSFMPVGELLMPTAAAPSYT